MMNTKRLLSGCSVILAILLMAEGLSATAVANTESANEAVSSMLTNRMVPFADSCTVNCHAVSVETPGQCMPGHHWADDGGTDGGVRHKNPETCFPGTCAERHACPGGGGEEEWERGLAVSQRGGQWDVSRLAQRDPGSVYVNEELQALQVIGCGDLVIAHIELSPTDMARAIAARNARAFDRIGEIE